MKNLSSEWRKRSREYVAAISAYVEKGRLKGWKKAGKQPTDQRAELAAQVLEEVRRANEAGDTRHLRADFPPAWEPFHETIRSRGQSLSPMAWIDDQRIALHLGATCEPGDVVIVSTGHSGAGIVSQPGVLSFGFAPDRSCVVIARDNGLEVRSAWEGRENRTLPWPTGEEGLPEGAAPSKGVDRQTVTKLIPFPGGERVLLACSEGLFCVEAGGAKRLLPTAAQYSEYFDWARKEYPEKKPSLTIAMEHCAISRDGELVLYGCQDSRHLVANGQLEPIAEIGPHSEYPHYAWFNEACTLAAFNGCHFYNGTSIGVAVEDLPGLRTPAFEEHEAVRELDDEARVYAAAAWRELMIVGDANGYLRAFDDRGVERWRHYIGSTINALDVSPDRTKLAVTSHAGFLCVLDLEATERDEFTIGTSTLRETDRFIFWKGERPLRW